MLSKNIGQFEGWTLHGTWRRFRLRLVFQSVQGTGDRGDQLRGNTGIARGGVDLAMTEQGLDDANIGAAFQ